MLYHIIKYGLCKAYGSRCVGAIRKYPFQFWIPFTLRLVLVQGAGVLFLAHLLKKWMGMSVQATGIP